LFKSHGTVSASSSVPPLPPAMACVLAAAPPEISCAGSKGPAEPLVCSHCGAALASRNALFRHLTEKCDPLAAKAKVEKERVVLAIGYLGSRYHGCVLNEKDEAGHQTVEGAVMAAVRKAWGGDIVLSVARCTRTERAAHAAENLLVLTVRPTLRCDDALRKALEGAEVWLLAPSGPAPSIFDKVYSPKKRAYTYYIPYSALLTAEERLLWSVGGVPAGLTETEQPAAAGLWVAPVPGDCAPEEIVQLFSEHGGVQISAEDVFMTPGRGQAEVRLSPSSAAASYEALNGLIWRGEKLFVLPLQEANAKFAVQRRLRQGVKALRGPPKGLRSFHNFISDIKQGDPAAMRQLQHCSAGSAFSDFCPDRGYGHRWVESDWSTVSFSAADFGPQQLRRMVGALVAVVRGTEGLEYLTRCFDAAGPPVDTVAAPAESVCLEGVEFGYSAGDWRETLHLDGAAAAAMRRRIAARAVEDGRRPWRDFVHALDAGATRAKLVHRLAAAAESGALEGVLEALEEGAPVDAANEYGQTAAFLAAASGHRAVVQALLERRADGGRAANGGATPCSVAASWGHIGVLEALADSEPAARAHLEEAIRRGVDSSASGSGSTAFRPPSRVPVAPATAVVTEVIALSAKHVGAGACYVDGAFSEELLGRLEELWRGLPVASKEKFSTNERAYFADTEGWVTAALDAAVAAMALPTAAETMPLMRFLWYPEVGGSLPQHVDLSRKDADGRKSTHTFILYVQDCGSGGETNLLSCLGGDAALAAQGGLAAGPREVLARVQPRRGRLFLFPHICPHSASPVLSVPKVLLRGEVLPPKLAQERAPDAPLEGAVCGGSGAGEAAAVAPAASEAAPSS